MRKSHRVGETLARGKEICAIGADKKFRDQRSSRRAAVRSQERTNLAYSAMAIASTDLPGLKAQESLNE
jgi:hypothetical protein